MNLRLADRMPNVKLASSFKVLPYVPKSNLGNGVDRGLYLMRHMETFKGNRRGYSSGMKDVSHYRLLILFLVYLRLFSAYIHNCLVF